MSCSCYYNIVYFCVISYKPLSIVRIPHSPLINLFHTLAFPTPKHVTSPTPVTTTRRIGTKRVDIVIPFSFVLLYHRILEVINEYKLIGSVSLVYFRFRFTTSGQFRENAVLLCIRLQSHNWWQTALQLIPLPNWCSKEKEMGWEMQVGAFLYVCIVIEKKSI